MLLKTIFSENLANSQICAISQVHFTALQIMNSPLENRQIFSVKLLVGGLLYRCARQVFAPLGHEKYYFVLSEDDEVNGVIITTITSTHEGLLKRCIQAGKAIFCEKPIAESNERISMLQKVVNDLFMLRAKRYKYILNHFYENVIIKKVLQLLFVCRHAGSNYLRRFSR